MKKFKLVIWLYLLFISCFVQTVLAQTPPPFSTRAEKLRWYYLNPTAIVPGDDPSKKRVWIMAHRGAWDEESPESSIQAFKNAVTYGFEILELDVRFSAAYNVIGVVQSFDPRGPHREIILQHDKSNKRSKNNAAQGFEVSGLFDFKGPRPSPPFTDDAYGKPNQYGQEFVVLDKLVPYGLNGVNSIDGPSKEHPVLLKLDGSESNSKMVHFPKKSTYNNYIGTDGYNHFNQDFANFYLAVKDNILLNFDKMKDSRDFCEVYDLMHNNGLLNQCIFKAKLASCTSNANAFETVARLFKDYDNKERDLGEVMFTPIFTKYDFGNSGIKKFDQECQDIGFTDEQKYDYAKKIVDDLLAAENNTEGPKIRFAGCEIVYENTNEAVKNIGWLVKLAKYVKSKEKRVVQFSTNIESRQGAWSGNGNFWSSVQGSNVNYWGWLFNNSKVKDAGIIPDVFVGDKPLEFRSYLNFLRNYNLKPIQL